MVNVEVAWVICSSVALSSQFKIKSPGSIRSEGRPQVDAKTLLRFAYTEPESKAGNST